MSDVKNKIDRYLTRLKNGEKCFEEFFKFAYAYIEAVAFKYLFDRSKTDDVVNVVYKAIYVNLEKFDARKNGLAWIYEITKNEAYKINRRDRAKYLFAEQNNLSTDSDNISETILEKHDLNVAISKLGDEYQSLIDMRIFQGMDIKTIAKIKGVHYSTAYRTLKKIYKILGNSMKE